MKKNRIIAIVLLALIVLWAVVQFLPKGGSGSKVQREEGQKEEVKMITPPPFSVDSAMAYLKKQVEFGPRVPGTKAHSACLDWIVSECKKRGAAVDIQYTKMTAWNGDASPVRNVIAEFNKDKKMRVMLAAHWDSRFAADKDANKSNQKKAIDGANDGASGVAVLLEMARLIQQQSPEVGVDLVFFDNEDQGAPEWSDMDPQASNATWCLGSQHWARQPHKEGYQAKYGILLDMVGGKNARFNKEGTSMAAAGDVMNWVWAHAQKMGYGHLFVNEEIGGITDDHVYMNQGGIRSIDIIDMRPNTIAMGMGNFEFGSFHHTMEDNLSNIDPEVLTAVGRVVAMAVYNTK